MTVGTPIETHTPMHWRLPVILDVRTAEEYANGHAPGAINIPIDELSRRIVELGNRDRPVVVYCRSGRRSRQAAALLHQAGYSKVDDRGTLQRCLAKKP